MRSNNSFKGEKFPPTYRRRGMDFIFEVVSLLGESVKAEISWDSASHKHLFSIQKCFYQRAQGIVLVYDVNDENSYNNLEKWYTIINDNSDIKTIKYLVGNKIDLEEKRVVSYEDAEEMGKRFNMKYYETSALENNNIRNMFMDIIKESWQSKNFVNERVSFRLSSKEITKKSKCC